MQFITQSTGKKRQMVLLPEVNANTLLLFFEKGNTGYSWSLRDYSVPHRVVERYAREFGWSSADVRHMARFSFDAPTVDTGQLHFWNDYTLSGNNLLKVRELAREPVQSLRLPQEAIPTPPPGQFPILNLAALRLLPKAKKRGDLERMLCSANSEDWVTWNLLNLLRAQHPLDWWQQMVSVARTTNVGLQLSIREQDHPRLEFWRRVLSPTAYEQASRSRMQQSEDPCSVARSRDSKPVEGASEIDIVLSTSRHLVFIEAKLGSDISMRTTYDPCRNQIVRNIDCLLESAAGRDPLFWMLVRDLGPGRTYCQLVDEYRRHPETLIAELPIEIRWFLKRLLKTSPSFDGKILLARF